MLIIDHFHKIDADSIALNLGAQIQTVLIVPSGDDGAVSAPIGVDTLRSQALPLTRTDFHEDIYHGSVVKVSLATAVVFILDLQKREEAVILRLAIRASDRDKKADRHVDEVLRKRDRKGSKHVSYARFAMRIVEQRARGESHDYPEFDLWSPLWQ